MNRKLHKVLDEIQKTEGKIAVWQEHLKELNTQKELLEDAEIIKSVRSMKLGSRELLSVLEGVQSGTIILSQNRETEGKLEKAGSMEPINQEQAGDDGRTADLATEIKMPQGTALEREDLENESED